MTKSEEALTATIEIEIPFQDGDPMGVTWHGNYFRYLEEARCALLKELDYGYRQMIASGYAWPIIDTRLQFVQPTEFWQRIRVRASIVEYENRLKIAYEITDAESGKRVTKGYTTQVAYDLKTEEMCFVSPPVLFEKIDAVRR
jgi:acyl-CoA thioester hydrolase